MSLYQQLVAALALLPSVLFLLWFLRAASHSPEPVRVVVSCYVAGCAAFGVAVVVLGVLDPVVSPLPSTLRMFLGVAPVEETLKLVAILLAAGLPARWGRMTSGLIYAVAVSLGFAAVENILAAERLGVETGMLRALTAVPGHALHGALVGIQLGRSHRARSAVSGVLLGLLLAVLAHGLYNSLLLQGPTLRMLVVPLLLVEGGILMALLQRAKSEDVNHIVEQLRQLPALANAPTSSLRMLATRARRRRIEAGDRVFEEGDQSEAVYLLLGGKMTVDRLTPDPHDGDTREDIGNLATGAFFGEMGVLMGRKRSASVKADSDAMVLELSRTGLQEAISVVDGLAEELRDSARERGAPTASLPSITELHRVATASQDENRKELEAGSLAARLREVPLLAKVRTEALVLLAAGAYTEIRRRRSRLLRQGAAGRGLCVILDGRAGVFKDGEQVAELGVGDWFGEISLLTGFAATASVRALTAVELAVVDGSDLRGVVGLVPSVGLELLREIRARLKRDEAGRAPAMVPPRNRVISGVRRTAAALGFARTEAQSPEARALVAAFPELLELPSAAAEALAALGSPPDDDARGSPGVLLVPTRPDVLPGGWHLPDTCIEDALARCPHLLHLFARQVARDSD